MTHEVESDWGVRGVTPGAGRPGLRRWSCLDMMSYTNRLGAILANAASGSPQRVNSEDPAAEQCYGHAAVVVTTEGVVMSDLEMGAELVEQRGLRT